MREAFRKTVLVVDEGSLASTAQARELLKITDVLRLPRVVLVGDSKQLDAVDAGKPFAQLQSAGMKTAVMKEIMRQRDPDLKAAVEASLTGDVKRAFEKLGSNVAEVRPDNLAGAAAARWLALSPEARAQGRTDGAEPRDPRKNQRDRPRAPDQGRGRPRPRVRVRTTRLSRLHTCREVTRRELRTWRRRGLPPSLQAPGRREGRRTPRRRASTTRRAW